MGYTKFGEYFRILRIKHNEVMNDLVGVLGAKPSFISSVETGKKSIPESWFGILSEHYHLDSSERDDLMKAIQESAQQVKISLAGQPAFKREVALQLNRSFDDLDERTANEIKKILEKNK